MKSNFWSELQTQLQVIPLKKYSYNQQNQIPNTITLPFLITQANAQLQKLNATIRNQNSKKIIKLQTPLITRRQDNADKHMIFREHY